MNLSHLTADEFETLCRLQPDALQEHHERNPPPPDAECPFCDCRDGAMCGECRARFRQAQDHSMETIR